MGTGDHGLSVDTYALWEGPCSPSCYLNLTSQFTHYAYNRFIHQCELVGFIFSPYRTKWED